MKNFKASLIFLLVVLTCCIMVVSCNDKKENLAFLNAVLPDANMVTGLDKEAHPTPNVKSGELTADLTTWDEESMLSGQFKRLHDPRQERTPFLTLSSGEYHSITFVSESGKEGNINFKDTGIEYSGELPVKESAKMFFENLGENLKIKCTKEHFECTRDHLLYKRYIETDVGKKE